MPTYISMVSMSGNEPAEPGSVSDAISEGAPETRKLIEDPTAARCTRST